ncbi:MAG: hypothetical protein IPL84_05110 [Chitinophagaceae bacterium]|nr:hypothetical protein [Chitinophagaceae bacterium]
MSNSILQGHVSFVNHEKKYIIIEYDDKGKKKVVHGNIDPKFLKKKHSFSIGDTVTFSVGLSGRGDRMIASDIEYLYNTALDVLINKAKTENNFIGYLKVVDDQYFVKEIDSYLFFPVPLSPWQLKPTDAELNEAVTFALENTEKKNKITAKLYNNKYIPEFYTAVKLNKANTPVDATVYKVTPHGIYLNLVADKIHVKLPFKEGIKVNDTLSLRIVYLSPFKIIAEEL